MNTKELAKYGMSLGAYDGANNRRFVLFIDIGNGTVMRREFETKRERDFYAEQVLEDEKSLHHHD